MPQLRQWGGVLFCALPTNSATQATADLSDRLGYSSARHIADAKQGLDAFLSGFYSKEIENGERNPPGIDSLEVDEDTPYYFDEKEPAFPLDDRLKADYTESKQCSSVLDELAPSSLDELL